VYERDGIAALTWVVVIVFVVPLSDEILPQRFVESDMGASHHPPPIAIDWTRAASEIGAAPVPSIRVKWRKTVAAAPLRRNFVPGAATRSEAIPPP
jgi:hypothetical protein